MSRKSLTRKQYKTVKKYDHNQMNDWATSLYKSGYQDAMEKFDENSLSLEDVANAIDEIKGIGEKRKSLIIEKLEQILSEKENK